MSRDGRGFAGAIDGVAVAGRRRRPDASILSLQSRTARGAGPVVDFAADVVVVRRALRWCAHATSKERRRLAREKRVRCGRGSQPANHGAEDTQAKAANPDAPRLQFRYALK